MTLRTRILFCLSALAAVSLWLARSPDTRQAGNAITPSRAARLVKPALPPTLPAEASRSNDVVARLAPEPPAGTVKVVPTPLDAPVAIKAFRNWANRYFDAEPAVRPQMLAEGERLADKHREALGALILSDPKAALDNAVPMVVRQDLPPAIVQRLEERVNKRGQFLVAGAVPVDGKPSTAVTPVQRWFTPAKKDGETPKRYSAYVYGERAPMQTVDGARINGVAVNGSLAVLDAPVRQLEVGERPDPAKLVVSICPVSGTETQVDRKADETVPPVQETTPAAEDDTTIHYFCAGGHITDYGRRLASDERRKYWEGKGVAAEGATGGGMFPFNPPAGWTTGTNKILYIRCAFPEQGNDPQSEAQCYANLKQTTDYFMESSRGRFYLTGTVAPLVILPYPESWYNASRDSNNQPDGDFVIYDQARELARRLGYDTNDFDMDVVRWDNGPGSYGGLGSVGGKLVILKTNAVGVLMHELGHNLGLWHSNYWQTNPPKSINAGANLEYGNIFDVMGNSGSLGHYVAPHKAIINWLTSDQYHDARSNGTYRIYQTDQGQADAGKRYALRTPRDSDRNYWLEMRQQFTTQPALFGGLMLTWDSWGNSGNGTSAGSNGGAQLIDTTPGSGAVNDTRNDAAIAIGRTFSDTDTDLHITPVVKGTTVPPYIDVVVNRGPFPGNRAPALSILGPTSALTGQPATFTASSSDPDGDAVSFYWDFGDGTFSTDGLSTSSKTWAVDGDYRVTCTASDRKGKRTTRGLTVTVGSGGAGFTISGTIIDSSSQPIEGMYVANRTLISAPAQPNVANFRYAITDSNGVYVLTNVPAGNVTITPHNPPYTFSPDFPNPLSVSADSSGRDFQMSAGVSGNTITVNVVDGTAQEAAGAGRTATITLTRTGSLTNTLDVPYLAASTGTAIRNTDYTLNPAPTSPAAGGLRYQFAANSSTITITLTAVNDSFLEGEEYAVLEFPDAVPGYTRIGPKTVTIPITDDDSTNPVVTLIQSEPSSSEAGDLATLVLQRNGSTADPLTVKLAYSGVAVLDSDFFAPTSVTIPSGSASTTVTITPFDDIYAEGTEFGTVSLVTDAAYQRDSQRNSGQFYITDNDQSVVTVTAADATASETGNNPGKFTISRTAKDLSQPLTIQYSMGGSALQGPDYRRVDGNIVIPAHELSADIEIIPFNDGIDEPDETVICRLATDDGYAIVPPGSATVTITDDDGSEFSIRALPGRVQEPATIPARRNIFQVTRPAAGSAVSVPITFSGTATIDVDYTNAPTTVDFLATDTAVTVQLTLNNDSLQEDSERIAATLGTGPGVKLTREKSAYVDVLDANQPTVDVSLADQTSNFSPIRESAGTFRFFVSRTNADLSTNYTGDLTVPFTLSGTATAGTDYTATASPLVIPDGQAGAYITVTLTNDTTAEGTETVVCNISTSGAYGRGMRSAAAYIEDNDAYAGASPPSVQFATTSSTVNERTGVSGASTLQIPVNITGTRASSVFVDYYVSSGSANGLGVDYTLAAGTLTFTPTDTSKNITLTTTPDSIPEGNEDLTITLWNNVGTNIGTNDSHTVTITDLAVPEALTDTVNNLPGTTATLRGKAVANGVTTDAWFEWGTSTTSFPNSTTHQAIGTGHSLVTLTTATISGLTYPGTYYYRTVAQNSMGTTRGVTRTIRTAAPPTGNTLPTTVHDASSATFFGSINPNRLNAEIWFEWGTTTAYGNVTPRQAVVASTTSVTVSTPVTGLVENTIYHYRLRASTSLGTVTGDDFTVAAIPHRVSGDLLVNLSAKHASAGTAAWTNQGSLGGTFAASGTPVNEPNVLDTSTPGVWFDAATINYTGPTAPADISASSTRTLEVWVNNPGLASADEILSIGTDNPGQNCVLAYANSTAAGAMKHGDTAGNAGYPTNALPLVGKWHHLVYTYNGNKVAKVYVDGVLKITKTLAANLNTAANAILLGGGRDSTGTVQNTFGGFINSVRIHGGELAAADVLANYNLGPALPSTATAPLAVTRGASAVTLTSATLNAVVVPQGAATTAWIEWGTSTAYDNATLPVNAGSDWTQFALAAPVAGLAGDVEYHFRVVAQNSGGTTYGADTVFTTTALANAGILWVDLRSTDATAGTATWHNRGALGNFARVGTPAKVTDAGLSGFTGVQFNGSTDVYESFALADADISFSSDRTIETWAFNSSATGDEAAVSLGRDQARRQQLLQFAGVTNAWKDATTATPWASVPVIKGWHHLVLVHQGTSVLTYVDGVLSNTTAVADGADTRDDPVTLGAMRDSAGALTFASNAFSGYLNTVRIHGGALSASQVAQNFAAGPLPKPGGAGSRPIAFTDPVTTSITGATAVLHGTVAPGGKATSAWFEWGTNSAALDKTTPLIALPNLFGTAAFSESIGGLTSGQTYYFRMMCISNAGHDEGAVESFVATGTVPNLPAALTSQANGIGDKAATLNGTATPNGLASSAWFEYGLVNTSGTFTTAKTSVTAAAAKVLAVAVKTLSPHSNYWFRLVVENTAGKVFGEKLTFSTTNTAPLATAGSVTIKEDVPTVLALKGTDGNAETLSIVVTTPPAHGFLTGTSLAPLYTPNADYNGTDSFQFAVTDGAATSAPVIFTLTITAQPDGPLAVNNAFSGPEDTNIVQPSGAYDPDGDAITSCAIVTPPTQGTVTITSTGTFTYVPATNFFGPDFFTYTATNAGGTSLPGRIDLTITAVNNDPPVALNTGAWTDLNTPVDGQAEGSDPDGTPVTFTKLTDPAHGSITNFNTGDGSFTYTPTTGYTGTDSFTFKVRSSGADSNIATITLTTGGATAYEDEFSGPKGDQITDDLRASGPGSLEFILVSAPAHGTIGWMAVGTFFYTPAADFIGDDKFTFKVNNGTADSNVATVTLHITPRPPQWTWAQGPSVTKKPGTYGTLGLPAATNIPGARSDSVSWTDASDNLWLFGGSGYGNGTTSGLLNDLWKRDVSTGEWTWMGGSATLNAGGTYGAQGLGLQTYIPGARSGATSWVGQDGKLWLFGGSGRDGSATGKGLLNDLWVYDPLNGTWTWKKGSNFINANGTYGSRGIGAGTNSPGARNGAVGWVDALGRLWLFGGNGRGATGTTLGNLNDLWCYTPATNQWAWIGGVSTLDPNGTYNVKGDTAATSTPGGRSFATAWCSSQGKFFLFGGTGRGATGTTKGNLNDLWCYDWAQNAWTWITGGNAVNGAATYGLRGVASTANTPGARTSASAITDGSSNTILFGGQGTGAMNDVWRFDENLSLWTWINGPQTSNGAGVYGTLGVSAPGTTPGARRAAATITDGSSNTILVGGANGTTTYSDVWTLESAGLPQVRTVPPDTIGSTSAHIRSYIRTRGIETEASLDWWPLGDPGNVTTEATGTMFTDDESNTLLTGLTPGTTYVFQARAYNANGTAVGRQIAFTTTGAAAPIFAEFDSTGLIVPEASGLATATILLSEPATAAFTIPLTLSGTATSGSDYTAPALTVSFVPGQTSALVSVPVMNDGVDEGDETVVLTLGTPSGVASLGAQASHTFTITDDEDLPVVSAPPASQFVKVGDAVTFTVGISAGSNVKYQWKKDGTKITGATNASYTIAAAALTSAGNYVCELSNTLTGTTPVTTSVAELFVVDATPKTVLLASGNTSFTVTAKGPSGTTLAYSWRDSITNPIPDIVGHRAGATTNMLAFTGLLPTDSERYVCRVSKLGTPSLNHDSGTFTLAVPDAIPVITSTTLPTAVVGVPYSQQIQVDGTLRKSPTGYTFSGLPAGLTGSTITGVISGKATTAGTFPVTITAKNAIGPSAPATVINLQVLALPGTVQGSFAGLINRIGNLGNDNGGRFEISITNTGTYTAKVIMPGVTGTTSVTSSVVPQVTGANVTSVGATAAFKLTGGALGVTRAANTPATLTFSIDATTSLVTGSFIERGITYSLVDGYRNVWGSTAAPTAGDYSTFFDLPYWLIGDLETPQGSSYATFKVGADGKLTFVGKTADGLAFTLGTFAGPGGQIVGVSTYSGGTSVLWGTPVINGSGFMTSNIDWKKGPASTTSKDMAYRAGFDWIRLDARGGKYPGIANGGMLMNFNNADANAKLSFTFGGLVSTDAPDFTFNIRNNNLAKNAMTITYPLANPNKITFVLPATPTGTFNGSLSIPNASTALVRKVTYQGVITLAAPGTYLSRGFFLMPQLPQPGQSLTTSPVLSGQVNLKAP